MLFGRVDTSNSFGRSILCALISEDTNDTIFQLPLYLVLRKELCMDSLSKRIWNWRPIRNHLLRGKFIHVHMEGSATSLGHRRAVCIKWKPRSWHKGNFQEIYQQCPITFGSPKRFSNLGHRCPWKWKLTESPKSTTPRNIWWIG